VVVRREGIAWCYEKYFVLSFGLGDGGDTGDVGSRFVLVSHLHGVVVAG
jgi:hypothetical protein